MGLFGGSKKLDDNFMEQGYESGKGKRKKKKALKSEGYSRTAAKRMTGEDVGEDVISYGKGGKTSAKKTKHRGKTTYGRHQGY